MKRLLIVCSVLFLIISISSCNQLVKTALVHGKATPDPSFVIAGNLAIKDEKGTILHGKEDVNFVEVHYFQSTKSYGMVLHTNKAGTAKVSDFTKRLIHQQTSVYLDDGLLLSATVESEITSGNLYLPLNCTEKQATDLCRQIDLGKE